MVLTGLVNTHPRPVSNSSRKPTWTVRAFTTCRQASRFPRSRTLDRLTATPGTDRFLSNHGLPLCHTSPPQNAAQPFGRGVAAGVLRPLALVEGRRFHGIPAKWGCRVRVSSMEIEGTMADSWIGCSSSVKTWCCAEIFRRATSVDGFSQSPNAVSRSEEICAPYERPAQVPGERHESCRPEKCTPVQE